MLGVRERKNIRVCVELIVYIICCLRISFTLKLVYMFTFVKITFRLRHTPCFSSKVELSNSIFLITITTSSKALWIGCLLESVGFILESLPLAQLKYCIVEYFGRVDACGNFERDNALGYLVTRKNLKQLP